MESEQHTHRFRSRSRSNRFDDLSHRATASELGVRPDQDVVRLDGALRIRGEGWNPVHGFACGLRCADTWQAIPRLLRAAIEAVDEHRTRGRLAGLPGRTHTGQRRLRPVESPRKRTLWKL